MRSWLRFKRTERSAGQDFDDEADDAGNGRVRALRQDDATGDVSGGDGAGGAVASAVSADRAGLSKGRQRSPTGRSGADAAHLLSPALVQPVGPGGRGGAVRLAVEAALRR